MPPEDRDHPTNDLRKRAETISAKDESAQAQLEEMARLVHDLQVHQIELELQNEELLRTQQKLKMSRRQYVHLYDFAPVAYLTINQDGIIQKANLTAAKLLEVERDRLVGKPFNRFISKNHQDAFHFHRKLLLETGEAQTVELELRKGDGAPLWARLQSVSIESSLFRIVVVNITTRKIFEAREQKLRALSEALRDTALALNSTLKLDEVFDRILLNVRRVVPHDAAIILLINDGYVQVMRHAGYNPEETKAIVNTTRRIDEHPQLKQMYQTGEPVLIVDTNADARWQTTSLQIPRLRGFAGVPLHLRDKVIGFLVLRSQTPGFFDAAHLEHLQAFTDHAVIAIENARLHEKARELAAMEERQRLARNLHDAVSQTLFSANMISEALVKAWKERPEKVEGYLDRLYKLTRGAMAQMRTLLLELRPNSLAEAEIEDLLRQLTEAAEGLAEIETSLEIDSTAQPPNQMHQALYYIAQESLNNVIKHARATKVSINFYYRPDEMRLVIRDNGRGFEHTEPRSTALGLEIMHERAASFGGTLTIDSEKKRGTNITVTWG